MKIRLTKNDFGLLPDEYDQKAIEMYSSIPMGAEIEVSIKIPRDLVTHKRYFQVLSLAWHHLPENEARKYSDMDQFRKQMEMEIGWAEIANVERLVYVLGEKVEPIVVPTIELRPKSISFAEMDEDQFKDLYRKMKKHLTQIFSEWGYDTKFLILQ